MATKWTEGWLCGEPNNDVLFIPTPIYTPENMDVWTHLTRTWWPDFKWENEYNLTPPAPGKKFLVDLEL